MKKKYPPFKLNCMLDSLDIQRFFPMRRPFVRFRYPLGEGLSSRPWCVNFQSPLFNQPLTQPHAAILSNLSLMPFSASLSRFQLDSALLSLSPQGMVVLFISSLPACILFLLQNLPILNFILPYSVCEPISAFSHTFSLTQPI